MKFLIVCIDGALRHYRSQDKIVKQLDDDTRLFLGKKGYVLLSVFNFNLLGVPLERLTEWGVVSVMLDELSMVTDLERLQDAMPTGFNARELLLIEGCQDLCLSVSDRFQAQNDISSAIEWAERSIKFSPGVTLGHRQLSEMYRQAGDKAAVERVALAALDRNPKVAEYLVAMKRLSAERGDTEAETNWSRRLNDVLEAPSSFETLIKRPQVLRSSSPTAPVSAKPDKRAKRSFLRKLFPRVD